MRTIQPVPYASSAALLASLFGAALVLAPVVARAHVGDVVALVDAHALSSLAPPAGSASAAGAAAAMRDGHEPLAATSAPLAQALTAHGLDVALGLGPA